MSDAELFEKRIATVVDRFDGKLRKEYMELILQKVSQDLREQRDVEGGRKRA